jgi:transcriptional regulator with XRE-family HTH domain
MSTPSECSSFAEWLRSARERCGEALRDLAAELEMDHTVLCRFESGERLPTEDQAARLAGHFKAPSENVQALRLAGQIRQKYAADPAMRGALILLAEEQGLYKTRRTDNRKSR